MLRLLIHFPESHQLKDNKVEPNCILAEIVYENILLGNRRSFAFMLLFGYSYLPFKKTRSISLNTPAVHSISHQQNYWEE